MWHISQPSVPGSKSFNVQIWSGATRKNQLCALHSTAAFLSSSASSNYAPGWLQGVGGGGGNNYLNVWWWHHSVVPATDFKRSQGARVASFKPVDGALWSLTEDIRINHVQDHEAVCVKGWGETHLSWKKQGRGCTALACYQRGCPYHTIMWNG